MRTITHAIDTRPFFLHSVLLEKKRPGNEARHSGDHDFKISVTPDAQSQILHDTGQCRA